MKGNRDNKLIAALSQRFDTKAAEAVTEAVRQMEAGFDSRFGEAETGSMDAFVYGALTGGGKRLRPILMYLCSGFGQASGATPDAAPDPSLATRLMQAIELIHAASLVHDDIIDHSPLRHGQPTINAEKGDGYAARCGFAMVSEALKLLNDLDDNDIAALFADIPMEMCLGELMQIDIECRPEMQSVAEYYERIEKKTARLIEGSCRAGGYLCQAPPAVLEALSRYGHALGILFQLRDDLLDYAASPGDGKPVAQDIERGIYSMPLLYAMETTDAGSPQGKRLRAVMAKDDKTPEEIDFLLKTARETGGVAFTHKAIDKEIGRAREALAQLPDNDSRKLLAGLLELFSAQDGDLARVNANPEKKVV